MASWPQAIVLRSSRCIFVQLPFVPGAQKWSAKYVHYYQWGSHASTHKISH